MTVDKYVERWTTTVLPLIDKPASRDTFFSQLKAVVGLIGEKELSEVNGSVLQDLVLALRDGGKRCPRTVKLYLTTFRMVLSQAVTEGVIPEMPPKPKLAKVVRRQQDWLKVPEMRDLIAVAKGRTKILFALLAETGARIGEIVGLKWSDIDLEKRTLHIQRSIYKNKEQDPKTEAAFRKIAISSYLAAMLKDYRGEAKDDDLVLRTRTGACWSPEKSWQTVKKVFLKLKMKPVGMHSWRRGCTTALRNIVCCPLTLVDYRTGHRSQGLTDGVYTYTGVGDDKPWIERIGALFFDPDPNAWRGL